MDRPPTSEEERFAKLLEAEIEPRFYLRVKRERQAETLEEVHDSYRLLMRATDVSGWTPERCHFSSQLNITTIGGDILKMWVRTVADLVVERLLSIIPKSEGRIVLMVTSLVFLADPKDPGAEIFNNYISFQYHVDEVGIRGVRWSPA